MLSEYADFNSNMQALLDTIQEKKNMQKHDTDSSAHTCTGSNVSDETFYRVRSSVCITGTHSPSISQVKVVMSDLCPSPMALESFHVRSPEDLTDNSILLVPKVVMVANHCPGRKVLDESGDQGQLDAIYDVLCEVGADIMLILMSLPVSLYPPMTHALYHTKMSDMVFPNQPLLRHMAENNSFLTVGQGCDFNALQRNVLREWLMTPVDKCHPIYETAQRLCQENRERRNSLPEKDNTNSSPSQQEKDSKPATESHPLADRSKKKKTKKRFAYKFLHRNKPGGLLAKGGPVIPDGLAPVTEFDEEDEGEEELNMMDLNSCRITDKAITLNATSSAVL